MYRTKVELIILIFLAAGLFTCFSCKKDSPPEPPTTKDPRTYTWVVDTLQHPESFQTSMERIWGSTPNNVYVVGHNDVGKRKMYDGQRWDVVPITQNEGGPIERPNLSDIFGFGSSNIFAVGDRPIANPNPPPPTLFASIIIHFDGMRWSEIPTTGLGLSCIAGNSSNIVYTAGQGNIGFVLSGNTPQPDTIPVTWPQTASFGIGSVTVTPAGEVYANATRRENYVSKYYFLRRAPAGDWRILDTAVIQPGLVENKWGYGMVWYSPWGRLYSTYGDVFMWNGLTWNRIFEGKTFLTDIKGRSEGDLFVCGHFGLLYHFNGREWFQFQQFADNELVLTALLVFENEVFLLGHQAGGFRSYVFHGK